MNEIEAAIAAAKKRWADQEDVMTHLQQAESRLAGVKQLMVGTSPQLTKVYLQLLQRLANAAAEAAPAAATAAEQELSLNDLAAVIAALRSRDDNRRQAARRLLRPEGVEQYRAAELGQIVIDNLARMVIQYESEYQVGTQFTWALQYIVYDQPAWLHVWLHAATPEEENPAAQILASFYYQTPPFLQTVLQQLPTAPSLAQKKLLHSLRWLAQIGARSVREDIVSAAAFRLLQWLPQVEDEAVKEKLVQALGYWPARREEILSALYEQANSDALPEDLQRAILHAVARQAAHDEAAAAQADGWLQKQLQTAAARSAWVRLQLATEIEGKRKKDFLQPLLSKSKPIQIFPRIDTVLMTEFSAAETMQAVWEAGADDDVWKDGYHKSLAIAARDLLAQHPNLLPQLLSQYAAALDKESWEARRILLAVVAACLETMPRTVQQAWQGSASLESLLLRGAGDHESFTARRHALTGLSYLRHVSAAVVPVLVAGFQDNVDDVQKAAIEATRRFQHVEPGVIFELGRYLTAESIQTAYGVSQMLAALGRMAAGENSDLRQEIIMLLVDAIQHESSRRERKVVDEWGVEKNVVPLQDAFFEALLQVAGLPA